jgi:two-component system, NtrC family, sensor kinase
MRCPERHSLAVRWHDVSPAAFRGATDAFAAQLRDPDSGFSTPSLASIIEGEPFVHHLDLKDTDTYRRGANPLNRAIVDLGGARTGLLVPLVKDGVLLGAVRLYRTEVRPFSGKQIALLRNFAAQAVIAIENARLLGELQERTAALAERNSEYGEQIERQAATIDVLKVMSASPGGARPVFELIVLRARALCGADYARMALLDGDMLHLQAHTGVTDAALASDYEAQFPRQVSSRTLFGRAILARAAVQAPDLWVDAEHHVASAGGAATGAR